VYAPLVSVVRVSLLPLLSVMTTSTFGIPGSPGSCCSLLLTSSNTIPVTVPVGFGVGASVGASVGNWKPSLSVAVPPSGTTTAVGSLPPVCTAPSGSVSSAIFVEAEPIGKSVEYSPKLSVMRVSTFPRLSVTTTSTPWIPSSPASCEPLPLVSSYTTPSSDPDGS